MKVYLVRASFYGITDSIRLFRRKDKALECCKWYTETANAYKAACYESTNYYDGEYDYKIILQTYKGQA